MILNHHWSNIFYSDDWKSSRFATIKEERKTNNGDLDIRFMKNIVMCLNTTSPLFEVPRLMNFDLKAAMGFIN
jgi:hypothetical protein